jgi:hypothetical protein
MYLNYTSLSIGVIAKRRRGIVVDEIIDRALGLPFEVFEG